MTNNAAAGSSTDEVQVMLSSTITLCQLCNYSYNHTCSYFVDSFNTYNLNAVHHHPQLTHTIFILYIIMLSQLFLCTTMSTLLHLSIFNLYRPWYILINNIYLAPSSILTLSQLCNFSYEGTALHFIHFYTLYTFILLISNLFYFASLH